MDYVDIYYTYMVGKYPFETDLERNISNCTIEYLEECGLSSREILKAIIDFPTIRACLYPEDLPGSLWEGSLIEKNKFYYNYNLTICPPPPTTDLRTMKTIVKPFYKEMKIRFTMNDLIDYFYKTTSADISLEDLCRDSGQFRSILSKIPKVDGVEALDILLGIIDAASMSNNTFYSPFDLMNHSEIVQQVREKLANNAAEAKLEHRNQVIWRYETNVLHNGIGKHSAEEKRRISIEK